MNITFFYIKDFLRLVGIAFILAVPVSYVIINRWLQNYAYSINPAAMPFILAGTMTMVIALLTVGFQVGRAALADPVKSLRYEWRFPFRLSTHTIEVAGSNSVSPTASSSKTCARLKSILFFSMPIINASACTITLQRALYLFFIPLFASEPKRWPAALFSKPKHISIAQKFEISCHPSKKSCPKRYYVEMS
jgi:hypothetical protein